MQWNVTNDGRNRANSLAWRWGVRCLLIVASVLPNSLLPWAAVVVPVIAWPVAASAQDEAGDAPADEAVELAVELRRMAADALVAELARERALLRGAQGELRALDQGLALLADALELERARLSGGLTTELDVARAEVPKKRFDFPVVYDHKLRIALSFLASKPDMVLLDREGRVR
jgi:hypothetical protein